MIAPETFMLSRMDSHCTGENGKQMRGLVYLPPVEQAQTIFFWKFSIVVFHKRWGPITVSTRKLLFLFILHA